MNSATMPKQLSVSYRYPFKVLFKYEIHNTACFDHYSTKYREIKICFANNELYMCIYFTVERRKSDFFGKYCIFCPNIFIEILQSTNEMIYFCVIHLVNGFFLGQIEYQSWCNNSYYMRNIFYVPDKAR